MHQAESRAGEHPVTSRQGNWDKGQVCRITWWRDWQTELEKANLIDSFSFFNRLLFLKRFYLLIFGERGKEGERGEKHRLVASHRPQTGDLACNPSTCRDWEANWWSSGSQTGAQSTKPQQPRLVFLIKMIFIWLLSAIIRTSERFAGWRWGVQSLPKWFR